MRFVSERFEFDGDRVAQVHGQLGPQGIERTQPGTHTEPDDRCRNQDQQHFGQQHAEQDVAHFTG